MLAPEIELLLRIIDEGYNKKAWHGPNLRGAIKRVEFAQAAWRPAPERHNVWEHVVHAAYWKYIVRRRLLGEKKGSFPLKGSNWFVRPVVLEARAWLEDLALLEEMHQTMRAAVAGLDPEDLRHVPTGNKVSNCRNHLRDRRPRRVSRRANPAPEAVERRRNRERRGCLTFNRSADACY